MLAKGSQSAEHADESNDEHAEKLFAYDVLTKPDEGLLGGWSGNGGDKPKAIEGGKQQHQRIACLTEKSPYKTEAEIDLATVQTNLMILRLPGCLPDAETVVRRAKEKGILVLPFAPRTLRATTHRNVSAAQCRRAGQILATVFVELA